MTQMTIRPEVAAAMKAHAAYLCSALERINAASSPTEADALRRDVREEEARYCTFLADALAAAGAHEQSARMRAATNR